MIKPVLTVLLVTVMAAPGCGQHDRFEQVKESMAKAACCRFEFLSIVKSQVFESVDTTEGTALIASDGRYYIAIGRDQYLKTADRLYSYSGVENQLTIEASDSSAAPDETVSFVTRLDDFYVSTTLKPGREYYLRRIDSTAGSLPDSLHVFVSGKKPELDRLEYLDVNEDRNQIVFLKREYRDLCDEQALTPHFPDSAQIIRLQ